MEYDSLNTMLALNMAIVSVNRIFASHDRAVLEWEYRNIINRLALGNIQNHPAIKAIYKELMDFIVGRGLRDEEIRTLRETSTRREQEAWYKVMAEGTKDSGGLWNFLGNMSRKLESKIFGRGFMMSYYGSEYKYEAEKQKISLETDAKLWQLTKADIEACNALYTRLLSSSWDLLSDYGLGDEYRLTSESLEALSLAVNENRASVRLDMLKFIEHLFRVYPPYWFLCAETAYEAGREAECRKFMDKFEEVWRPVLSYDPYKLEATKYRIREIASQGGVSGSRVGEVRQLLDVVREYTPPGDWSSTLFAGIVYSALGENEQGMIMVKSNIDFRYEKELSSIVLEQMKKGSLTISGIQEAIASRKTKDSEGAFEVGIYGVNKVIEGVSILALLAVSALMDKSDE